MAMDLPEAKGTYVLICAVVQMKRRRIGEILERVRRGEDK